MIRCLEKRKHCRSPSLRSDREPSRPRVIFPFSDIGTWMRDPAGRAPIPGSGWLRGVAGTAGAMGRCTDRGGHGSRSTVPCRTKVWLVSSRISQPSMIIRSIARFFRMFSVSLTSSCIILKEGGELQGHAPRVLRSSLETGWVAALGKLTNEGTFPEPPPPSIPHSPVSPHGSDLESSSSLDLA